MVSSFWGQLGQRNIPSKNVSELEIDVCLIVRVCTGLHSSPLKHGGDFFSVFPSELGPWLYRSDGLRSRRSLFKFSLYQEVAILGDFGGSHSLSA